MSEPKITPQEQIHYARVRWKCTWEHLVKTEDGWQIRLDRQIEGYDSLLGKWITLRTETSFEDLAKHGLKKEKSFGNGKGRPRKPNFGLGYGDTKVLGYGVNDY